MNLKYEYMYLDDHTMTIQVIDLKSSVCSHSNLPEGMMSQNFDLVPSFHFMAKKGNFLSFFAIQFSTFPKMKTKT